MNIYDFVLTDNKDQQLPLGNFRGKVLLIVNTATHCGFTPQYKKLESLYEKYQKAGLEIIDIPCNQFMEQAPEDDAGIESFCALHYKTRFLRLKKALVNGEGELPLYTYLKKEQGFHGLGWSAKALLLRPLLKKRDWNYTKNSAIKWNFTKFLVDRKGAVVARFEPTDSFSSLEEKIKECLEKN